MIASMFMGTAAGTATMPGFFFDDANHKQGTASATVTVAGASLSGSVTIANASFPIVTTYVSSQVLNNTTSYDRYKGTANISGTLHNVDLVYNATNGILVGHVMKMDVSSVIFYVSSDPTILSVIQSSVMGSRGSFSTVAAYDFTSTNAIKPPVRTTQVTNTSLPVVLPGGTSFSVTDPGSVQDGNNGIEGAYFSGQGPQNTDTSYESGGAQLVYGFTKPYRNVQYPSTYDELPLGTSSSYKWVTYYTWSPDLRPKNGNEGVYGTVHLKVTSGSSETQNINPMSFYSVNTYPAPGSTGAVSFGVGIGIGYGPLSAGISVSPTYDATSAAISSNGNTASADVDFNYQNWVGESASPTDANHAIGMQAGIGASDGADGFYPLFGQAVIDYTRDTCLFVFGPVNICFPSSHELVSGPSANEYSVENAHSNEWNVYTCCPSVATGVNYDLGDRAITDGLNPTDSTPTDRYTFYTGSPSLYVYHDFYRFCFAGPSRLDTSEAVEYFFYYWDASQSGWSWYGSSYSHISSPGVDTCWKNLQLSPQMIFPNNPAKGQYKVEMDINYQFIDSMEFSLG